jgi:hypothetical protein
MEKDARDWVLQSVNVVYVIPEKNRVKVAIQFKEVAPKGYFRIPKPDEFSGLSESERSEVARVDATYKDKAIEITYTDWSIWENIDGVWYAWETGTRGHLSMNTGPVAPN